MFAYGGAAPDAPEIATVPLHTAQLPAVRVCDAGPALVTRG